MLGMVGETQPTPRKGKCQRRGVGHNEDVSAHASRGSGRRARKKRNPSIREEKDILVRGSKGGPKGRSSTVRRPSKQEETKVLQAAAGEPYIAPSAKEEPGGTENDDGIEANPEAKRRKGRRVSTSSPMSLVQLTVGAWCDAVGNRRRNPEQEKGKA